MIVDIQLNPAVEPWPRLIEGVLAAEEAGFGTVWVYDHFDGSMLRGTSMIECFTLLGAYAARTSRIGIGPMVVNVANRNPYVMAMSALSVQHISGGRLRLGIGAGAAPGTAWSAEHRLFGIELGATVAERHRRFEAVLDVLDTLLAAQRPAELDTFPRAEVRPPVVVGVNSTSLARLVGRRCDGMNVRADHPELAEVIGAAREARAASPSAAQPFDVSVWTHWDASLADPGHPRRHAWAGLGVDRLILTCLDPFDLGAVAGFFRG